MMLANSDFRSHFDDCRSLWPARSDRAVGHRALNNESSDKSDAKARGARLPGRSINNAKGRKRKRQTEEGSDNDVYDPDNSPDNSQARQRAADHRPHRRPHQFASSPISRRSISSLLLVALIFILHLHLHLAQSGEFSFDFWFLLIVKLVVSCGKSLAFEKLLALEVLAFGWFCSRKFHEHAALQRLAVNPIGFIDCSGCLS